MARTDHSDTIAYLRVMLDLLAEMESGGAWERNELVQLYQGGRYTLTQGKARALKKFLDEYHREIEQREYSKKYEQLSLLEGVNNV